MCNCYLYKDLDLNCASISARIKETKSIISSLFLVSKKSESNGMRLYSCPDCHQHWQYSSAWNWGAKPYVYKIPNVTVELWRDNPFVRPDEILIYNAVMERFVNKIGGASNEANCNTADCTEKSLTSVPFCIRCHIKNLQAVQMLPQPISGKVFPPYNVKS